MSKKSRWAVGLLVLLAAGYAIWVATGNKNADRPALARSGLTSDELDPQAYADASRSKAPMSDKLQRERGVAPLITPVSEQTPDSLPSIMRRAAAGDTRAQCELASAVLICEGAVKHVEGLRRARELHTQRVRTLRASDPLRVESERWLENSRTKGDPLYITSPRCNEGTPPSRADMLRMLRESAQSGDPLAVELYLSGKLLRDADPAEIRQELVLYQAGAEDIARDAISRGNIVAAVLLAEAYLRSDGGAASNLSMLQDAVRHDVGKGMSYLYAIRATLEAQPQELSRDKLLSFVDDMIMRFESVLLPDEIASAKSNPPRHPSLYGSARTQAFTGHRTQSKRGEPL